MSKNTTLKAAAETLYQKRLEELRQVYAGEPSDQEQYSPLETGLNVQDTKDLLSALEYAGQANLEHAHSLQEAEVIFDAVSSILSHAQELFFCRCNKSEMLEEGKRLNRYTLACLDADIADTAMWSTLKDLADSQGVDLNSLDDYDEDDENDEDDDDIDEN